MLLPGCQILRICFIFTVIFLTVAAYPYPDGEKTFDIKIGFDLTNGKNGAPSLQIRDFEDSHEFKPRAQDRDDDGDAVDDKDDKTGPPEADRADSASSESEEKEVAVAGGKKESSESKSKSAETKPTQETPKDSSRSESREDTEEENKSSLKSTRALSPGEFEPEEKNPKIHKRDPEDDDDRRRRRKRALEKFDYFLRKSKKVKGLKKFAAYKRYRH